GGGVRHRARHVRDAVEDAVVDLEDRVRVRGRVRVLEAAALVDRDVDEDGTGLHPGHELVGDQLGCLGPGDEDRADDQVGVEHGPLDLERVGRDGLDPALVDLVDVAEPGDVPVEDGDVGAHTDRDLRGVQAGDAAADDDDLGRVGAGDAAEEGAVAAARAHQVV